MFNYEKSISKAIKKVRKRYFAQYNESVQEEIYLELRSITISYDYSGAWAEIDIAWGRDNETNPFHYKATITIDRTVLRDLDYYILGYIAAYEDEQL